MGGQRVGRPVADAAAAAVRFAAQAINSAPHRKLLLFAAFAISLAVMAVPILLRLGMPVAAGDPLKCYDSAGNSEPCVMQASASALRFSARTDHERPIDTERPIDAERPTDKERTTEGHQPASWTITALYQQASLATAEPDQPASWTPSAPTAQHTPGKRPALATCGHLLPCLFSSLRKGLTRIASAAANAGRARGAREHL